MQTAREVKLREAILDDLHKLQEIVDKADRTADDNQNARNLQAQIETNEAELADEVKVSAALSKREGYEGETRVSAIAAKGERDERGNPKERDTRSMGQRFAESDAFKAYRENPNGKSQPVPMGSLYLPFQQRALIYGGALSADMVRPQLLAGIQTPREPIGTMAVRDVLLGGTTTSDSITFVKENVFTNAAATVAEATLVSEGLKPESSLTFTQVTAPVEVIAHGIPLTRQAIDDVPQLQSYVEGRLLDGLRREENDQLLNGDGTAPNISGILDQSGIQNLDQTYFTGAAVQNPGAGGPENFNRILRSKTLLMTTGDSQATFLVANPTDWEVLITLADTTDQYFGMGPFDAAQTPRIWGLDVVLTEDKAAGSYLVGDGTAAQVWDRWAAQVQIFDQHSDYAARNLYYLRAEERVGLTVFRPAAFALVDAV
jgi:HK97 family phage major capsid protein